MAEGAQDLTVRHTLPAGVYYRLRLMQAEQERDEARALLAQAALQERTRRYQQALSDAARVHGFDGDRSYAWDDTACALVPHD